MHRVQQLEHSICTQGEAKQAHWLDEYIALGLEYAEDAKIHNNPQQQENWLKRLYLTLAKATQSLSLPHSWRLQCEDYLYQPLFALKHLHKNQPQGDQAISRLYRELSVNGKHLF